MKQFYTLFLSLFLLTINYANTIGFEKNIGQVIDQNENINKTILYSLRLNNFNVNFQKNGFNYDFYEIKNDKTETHRVEYQFRNYNKNYKILTQEKIDYFENIIINNKDYTINFYQKIIYKNFYNHIDLEFYVNNDSEKPFEYNFVLHPGADINDIKFEIKGANAKLNSNKIELNLRFGELIESLPKSWTEKNNKKKDIDTEYCYHQDGTIGLQTNLIVSKDEKLVVDPLPIRKWGTYYATNKNSSPSSYYSNIIQIKDVTYDTKNNIIAKGYTNLLNLATSGTFQQTISNGFYQIFLVKFNEKEERLWGTYYGKNGGDEYATFVDTDNQDNIYFVYATSSQNGDLTTPGSYQPQKGNNDDFLIVKLNSEGKRVWATFLGGNSSDDPRDIEVDKTNNVLYVGGQTMSSDLKFTSNALYTNNDSHEVRGLIAKFDLDGNYIWSSLTYTRIQKIKSTPSGIIYVSDTDHQLHENSPEFIENKGANILTKFTPNLNIIWSTKHLGGTGSLQSSYVFGLEVDSEENIIIAGFTNTKNGISTPDAYSLNYNFENYADHGGFISKYDKNGNRLYGTYVGERGYTAILDLVINNNDEIIVVGSANNKNKIEYGDKHFSSNIENRNEIDWNGNGLLMKFDKKIQPIWGFLYGDYSRTARFYGVDYNNTKNDIIVGGWTTSPVMISTPNSFQSKPARYNDQNKSMQDNAMLVLFSDVKNDFKIDKTGNDCQFSTLMYTASGADSYEWTDIEGNIYSTTSYFTPAKIGEYICKFTKGDQVGYISIYVREASPTLPPTPLIPILPKVEKYCFVNLEKPKALTACGEEIEGTTTKTYFDIPGTYTITWIYTDRFNNTIQQNQEIVVLAADNFLNSEPTIKVCENNGNEVFDLTSIENQFTIPEKITYQYYKTLTDLENNLTITTPSNFINIDKYDFVYVKGTLESGCSNYTKIYLNITPKPIANNLEKTLCDASSIGYVNFDLTTLNKEINPNSTSSISYYLDNLYTQKIDVATIHTNQIIYVKITDNTCENFSTIQFKLSNYTLLTTTPFQICKDDATIGKFNLADKISEIAALLNINQNQVIYYKSFEDAQNNTNPLTGIFDNNEGLDKIFATSISSDSCKTFVEIPLVENINPTINIENEYLKCKNNSIDISLNQDYNEILWSTGEINKKSIQLTLPGKYTVTVKNDFCSVTKEFEVKDYEDLKIDYKYDGQIVTFTVFNDLNTQFSLDGINWQNHSNFTLDPGEYTFYFKSINGCIETLKIYLYKDLPNFITPNGDGKNDTWNLSYIKDLKQIKIFNRIGRIIFEADESKQPIVWNGKYQLKQLPSDTYWYVIDLDNGEKIQGSILIKNK